MVPRLHKKGRSFKGAARYLLHDKEADTADRVAWVETRNLHLAQDNPDLAVRVMAATAMDQARLKQEAKIKNSGRKSNLSVLHFSLSWHEEQADDLDRPAMLGAAEAAISALGGSKHQAMIVCHDDEPQPHVHVLLNRVSPEDGRMLSSSKEKLKLSAWAEKYERETGKIYCDERVINNQARKRGEYTRGTPAKARPIYEADKKAPANDNLSQDLRQEQRKKDHALCERGRQLQHRQKQAWEDLSQGHRGRVKQIRHETARSIGSDKQQIRQAYRPEWSMRYHEKSIAEREFEAREETFMGRWSNRFKAIDLKRIVSGDEKGKAIGEMFGGMVSKSGRLAAHEREQASLDADLARNQRQKEQEAVQQRRQEEQQRLAENRRLFDQKRHDLILAQKMEKAKLRAEWKKRNQERSAALQRMSQEQERTRSFREKHQAPPRAAVEQDNQQATKPADLLPQDNAAERARQIDEWKQKQVEKMRDRKRQRNRGERDR